MQLTKNFNRQEFDCKDGTKVPDEFLPNVQEVANNLQILRDYLKVPVRVTGSGYRSQKHNKKVGGAKFSQHLTASGADINADGYTPKELAKEIEKLIKASSEMKKILRQRVQDLSARINYDETKCKKNK